MDRYCCKGGTVPLFGQSIPCTTTVHITPLWGGFPSSMSRQPRGCRYQTIRVRKTLGEMFPTPTFLAPELLQLWRYRAWKIGPGGAGVIYTVVYGMSDWWGVHQPLQLLRSWPTIVSLEHHSTIVFHTILFYAPKPWMALFIGFSRHFFPGFGWGIELFKWRKSLRKY